jgi:hypothetical protein
MSCTLSSNPGPVRYAQPWQLYYLRRKFVQFSASHGVTPFRRARRGYRNGPSTIPKKHSLSSCLSSDLCGLERRPQRRVGVNILISALQVLLDCPRRRRPGGVSSANMGRRRTRRRRSATGSCLPATSTCTPPGDARAPGSVCSCRSLLAERDQLSRSFTRIAYI